MGRRNDRDELNRISRAVEDYADEFAEDARQSGRRGGYGRRRPGSETQDLRDYSDNLRRYVDEELPYEDDDLFFVQDDPYYEEDGYDDRYYGNDGYDSPYYEDDGYYEDDDPYYVDDSDDYRARPLTREEARERAMAEAARKRKKQAAAQKRDDRNYRKNQKKVRKKEVRKAEKKARRKAERKARRKYDRGERKSGCGTWLILLILIIGLIGAFVFWKISKIERASIDQVASNGYTQTGELKYTNILLVGLDSREGELTGGVNSDTMIIANINNKTRELRLVSVYRDTYMRYSDGSYYKANHAYCIGGAEGCLAVLNRNLDMNMQKFATINFQAMIDMVDVLGGIDLEVTAEEVFWMNGYAGDTAVMLGYPSCEDLPEVDGVQHLDGLHALGYSRIRYTDGNDFKRTERQRTVLQAILSKAKRNPLKWNALLDKVLPQVYTNLSNAEMMKLGLEILAGKMTNTAGYPAIHKEYVSDDGQDQVVPDTVADNVQMLHEYLYPGESYTMSDALWEISEDLGWLTAE